MKLILIISVILIFSCKKEDAGIVDSSRAQLDSIKEPLFFLDSLGSGELAVPDKITQIKRFGYGWDNYYYFDYYPGTNKLKSILYKPASIPQSCSFSRCDFFYRKNRISKVEISGPSSGCQIVIHTYLFEYFPKGALKSVTLNNHRKINETFFSYDNSGRVNRIFYSDRYQNETNYRFSEKFIKYDASGNVSEVRFQPVNSITVTTTATFSYDSSINPFKGVFFPQNFLQVYGWDDPSLLFLSSNVVSNSTRNYQLNDAPQTFSYIVLSNNNRLYQYYYSDQFGSTFYYE
jgi:hypothetical protein